jgi:hypothetical protein
MKLKNLTKKIRRLEATIAKGTKKLAKLRRKLTAPPKQTARKQKPKKKNKKTTPTAKTAAPSRPKKKQKRKRQVSPERRAQLAAMMRERWAAKKAATGRSGGDSVAPAGLPS